MVKPNLRNRRADDSGTPYSLNGMLNKVTGLIQAVVLAGILWMLSSISNVREHVAVLEERVATLNQTTSSLQVGVSKASDDRYRRSDAEADFAKRDARIEAMEAAIRHNTELATSALTGGTKR